MVRGVSEAWSLEPIGRLRLGKREHPVPPLTFGRFQRLIASEPQKIVPAMLGVTPPKPKTRVERLMARVLKWSVLHHPKLTKSLWRIVDLFGLGKRNVWVPGAAPWIHICVPSIEEVDWKLLGTQRHLAQLFVMFSKAHDWSFIGDAIRFGEPAEPGEVIPTSTQVVSGLLAVAKATGYTVDALHEMPLDGFYLLVESLREQGEVKTKAQSGGGFSDNFECVNDADRVAALTALMEEAQEPPNG